MAGKEKQFLNRHFSLLFIPHTQKRTLTLQLSYKVILFGILAMVGLTLTMGASFAFGGSDRNAYRSLTKKQQLEFQKQQNIHEKLGQIYDDQISLIEKIDKATSSDTPHLKNDNEPLTFHTQEFSASLKKLSAYLKERRRVDAALPIAAPTRNLAISSGYGMRRDPTSGHRKEFHPGLDIRAGYGQPIYASAAGKVASAVRGNTGYGNYIKIKHFFGYSTLYGHLSQIMVGKNATVKRGTLIGYAGSSGRSTGPHLHFEVRLLDKHMNPAYFRP